MLLSPGEKLGPYEILARIGAGGMGEVYRARDTRLDRIVAVKVSSEKFSQRFENEARAVAALNHPNICTLHDVGSNYLVMEYIDGAPLKGPLPLDKALQHAMQICDALDAAHRKGITHRDLKPSNVLVTKSGIKLLDFGLAKRSGPLKETDVTQPLTGQGAIVGTLNYMSPEQLHSKEVDARSDIFAFGLVLYEMLTGKRAFVGDSSASVIAAILERPAPAVTHVAPASLDRVLKTCLEKDPEDRWQSARDVRKELQWAAEERTPESRSRWSSRWAPWALLVVITIAAATGWMLNSPTTAVALPQEIAFEIPPPPGLALMPIGQLSIDRLSPDGTMIYFRVSDQRYYLRRLNSTGAEQLPDWYWFGDPFWAPDSQSMAMPVRGRIFKMRIPKGAQELVADIGAGRGGTWGEQGSIIVSQGDSGLYMVPAAGGKAVRLEVPGLDGGAFFNPQFLPGGIDFLFSYRRPGTGIDQIYLASLRDRKIVNPTILLENDTSAAFTPAGGGRVLFVRKNNLYSQGLDLKGRRLEGIPELLQERVATWSSPRMAYFSVSRNGSLAWRSGTEILSQVTIFDRKGNKLGTAGQPISGDDVQLSPDESYLMVYGQSFGGSTWIIDASGPGQTLISLGEAKSRIWSRDGSKIIFQRGSKILSQSATGSGDAIEICDMPERSSLYGVTPEDQLVAGDDGALFRTQLRLGAAPERLAGQASENGNLSPDGEWLVLTKPDRALYAQRVSVAALPRLIADTGVSASAIWRRDGKEILYRDREGIWSLRVDGSAADLRFGKPEKLFSVPLSMGTTSGSRLLAVNRDGSRIYYLKSADQPDSGVIHLRTNAVR